MFSVYLRRFFLLCSFICLTQVFNTHRLLAQMQDGVFVELDEKSRKTVTHRVGRRETLYSIARKYGTSRSKIKRKNPGIAGGAVQGILHIPIEEEQMIYRLPFFSKRSNFVPIYYQVRPKDNVFRISRIYFSMPTSLLVSRNRIKNEKLQPNQTLHIGWIRSSEEDLEVIAGKNLAKEGAPIRYEIEFKEHHDGKEPTSRNEVAFWQKDSPASGFYVMHRRAKERSYIEITNPLSNAKLYAKVIGTIPTHLYPEEIDMVLSQELAQALGARDSKFFVRVRYSD